MEIPRTITLENYSDYRGESIINYDMAVCKELDFRLAQVNSGFSKNAFTLRGLHYQEDIHAQAKLVYCLSGSIFSVAVDLRKDSSSYGSAVAATLSAENHKAMYIPRGFAHGYLTLEPNTLMQWCVDNDYCQASMRAISWKSALVKWPGNPDEYTINERDANAPVITG